MLKSNIGLMRKLPFPEVEVAVTSMLGKVHWVSTKIELWKGMQNSEPLGSRNPKVWTGWGRSHKTC